MKAIVTVIGKDKVGIVAGVSSKLAALEISIQDVSQTIMDDYFTMMMLVTFGVGDIDFENVRKELNQVGDALGVKVSIQNEEIFNAMHKL
ncbi:ACT domain-containing protein [Enterococcus sp. HY326]|uniref:ACT domain-containing protein n=1 Tax=Enterococcus sp. HY326 TaxID=2971265 RepID=UPI00223EEF36|nr:ACT domain-containing protein [Enterococcus sp. HY326]